MAATISKRQQARNERQLQDLIHTVPGNDRCADCGAKNPGWASWSLGVFLCVRCASLHRKLGTHVSKVKSLSMDTWSTEQVENMRKLGNVRSNAMYNPKNAKADIPIDADEVEGAMERFIRQKYELRTLSTSNPAQRQNTGSTGSGSWNEEPPPLPPKPKKFGFNLRSSSSTFHRPKQDRFTPPISPAFSGSDREATSPHKSKPSQLFGMKITTVGNNFDAKLTALQEMGFEDNRRNSEILKSSNGNVDKAVETLIRLGEGTKQSSAGAQRTLTPVSMGSSGITIEKTRQSEKKDQSNPWEIKEDPQGSATVPLPQVSVPQRSQSAEPTSNAWNPFLTPSQPQQSLESSFQNLHVSHTGPPQQPQHLVQPPSQQYQSNPFLQQQTSSSAWQGQQQPLPQQTYLTDASLSYSQPFQQQPIVSTQLSQPSNPFLQSPSAQAYAPSNPWATTGAQQVHQASNPWSTQQPMQPPIGQQPSPWLSQTQSPAPTAQQPTNPFGLPQAAPWQQQQQQNVFQQPATASPAPMYGQQEYFTQQQSQQQPAPSQQYQPAQQFGPQTPWQQQQQIPAQQPVMPPQQQYQQQFGQQLSARQDKASILALYNMPHLAPRQPLQTLPEDPNQQLPAQRSATMPMPHGGGSNPFTSSVPPSTQPIRHVSNESVDFVGMGAGGRHSPDAFAGLSARYAS